MGDVPGGPQEQARRGARPRRDDRGRQVPRRVRGPPEGGPEGDRRGAGHGHPLHRRAPHARRRRRVRRLDGRLEHAEARARPRGAARDRRDDAQRIPEVHREGRRARAALPARLRRRAVRRRHDRDPAGPAGALRDPPRRAHHRRGARGGRAALRPLHHRPVPARQGDRPRGRGRRAAAHARSTRSRPRSTRSNGGSSRSRSRSARSRRRRRRRPKSASKEIEKQLSEEREASSRLRAKWSAEKEVIQKLGQTKETIEEVRQEAVEAERQGNLQRVAELRYGRLPELEKELAAQNARLADLQKGPADAPRGGRRGGHRGRRRRAGPAFPSRS